MFYFFCRNATISSSSGIVWNTTPSPPTGWLSAPWWSSRCSHCPAPSPSLEVCVVLVTSFGGSYTLQIKHVLCVSRLPRPSGPLPRIPSHRQGSHSSLCPRRPACQRVCGQRVVQIPEQLPSATQVCIRSFFRHKFPLISS